MTEYHQSSYLKICWSTYYRSFEAVVGEAKAVVAMVVGVAGVVVEVDDEDLRTDSRKDGYKIDCKVDCTMNYYCKVVVGKTDCTIAGKIDYYCMIDKVVVGETVDSLVGEMIDGKMIGSSKGVVDSEGVEVVGDSGNILCKVSIRSSLEVPCRSVDFADCYCRKIILHRLAHHRDPTKS